jgi:hypothetical protein
MSGQLSMTEPDRGTADTVLTAGTGGRVTVLLNQDIGTQPVLLPVELTL